MNQKTARKMDTRTLVAVGMLCALAWVVGYMRIPIVPAAGFLKFDLKDVVTGIGALIYGPVVGFMMAVVVSLLEMITYSESGWIGFIMNLLATGALVCTASFIYSKMRNMAGAVIGLVSGVVAMTGIMLLWNYFITPIYMQVPREAVVQLLVPAFLPFNLLKASINAALILLLYKPVVLALRRTNTVPKNENESQTTARGRMGAYILALVLLVSCVLYILVLQGML